MTDKQYEYRIKREPISHRAHSQKKLTTVWFRSTNYAEFSPYGWDALTTTYPSNDEEVVNAVKQLWQLKDCEFIPARLGVPENMSTDG